jgi:heterodisulfide reductase subunit A
MMDVGRHPNIELLTNSEVIGLEGSAGDFKALVHRKATSVDSDLCTSCGLCQEKCPVKVPSAFERDLTTRPAIYTPFPQAVPSTPSIDREHCLQFTKGRCGVCKKVCPVGAIDYEEEDTELELEVGSVVVATGLDYMKPVEASEFGYGRFKNVVTSFEMERLLSSGGPVRGELKEFMGDRPLRKVAFIQCVGSRSLKRDIPYCSRICCMNAVKDAYIIREHYPDVEINVFFIDMRAFGKGFEEFFVRSRDELGTTYVRGKPGRVIENSETGELVVVVENTEGNELEHVPADLVVLSSAIIPSKATTKLAGVLGIEVDQDGFFKMKDPCAYPLDSTTEGIYLCGCSTGPKDITDSIAEASGAAALASSHVLDYRLPPEEEEIEPLDVSGEPRIGIFVCNCGVNIGGIVDVPNVTEYARELPGVVYAENVLFACAESTQRHIQQQILDQKLNRVVIAACTPKTHEPIFHEALANVGLNPYLLQMVNIRDQCSWVHQKEPEAATEKARDLIKMAVARVKLHEPLNRRELGVVHDVLVVGGGIAGIECALKLRKCGLPVHLVEKETRLGGRVSDLAFVYPSYGSGEELIKQKIAEIEEASVDIRTETSVKALEGFVGNFTVQLAGKRAEEDLKIGAIVLAIGADLYNPHGRFGYGTYSNVITSYELEQRIREEGEDAFRKGPKRVTFIQCVGSRGAEDGYPGCSRSCCQAAIKQSIWLRERGFDVTVLHRDIRVYSRGAEEMYRHARGLGVLFLPYDVEYLPVVEGKDKAERITISHSRLGGELVIPTDTVVLSVGMIPRPEDSEWFRDLLKVSLSPDRFFAERHPKLGPVETSVEGVFLCGTVQAPKDIADSIAQSGAVAAKVASLLVRDTIVLEPVTSVIDEDACRACGKCVEVCEFQAIELVTNERGFKVARVNEALCKGCGTCASVCPTGAIDIHHFTEAQVDSMVEALPLVWKAPVKPGRFEPKIVAFCCNWCSYPAADAAGIGRMQYPPNVRIIRVMCGGRIHTGLVMRALERGADGVLWATCHFEDCHYIFGARRAAENYERTQALVRMLGIEPERLRLEQISAAEAPKFARVISEFVEDVRRVGPNKLPVREGSSDQAA